MQLEGTDLAFAGGGVRRDRFGALPASAARPTRRVPRRFLPSIGARCGDVTRRMDTRLPSAITGAPHRGDPWPGAWRRSTSPSTSDTWPNSRTGDARRAHRAGQRHLLADVVSRSGRRSAGRADARPRTASSTSTTPTATRPAIRCWPPWLPGSSRWSLRAARRTGWEATSSPSCFRADRREPGRRARACAPNRRAEPVELIAQTATPAAGVRDGDIGAADLDTGADPGVRLRSATDDHVRPARPGQRWWARRREAIRAQRSVRQRGHDLEAETLRLVADDEAPAARGAGAPARGCPTSASRRNAGTHRQRRPSDGATDGLALQRGLDTGPSTSGTATGRRRRPSDAFADTRRGVGGPVDASGADSISYACPAAVAVQWRSSCGRVRGRRRPEAGNAARGTGASCEFPSRSWAPAPDAKPGQTLRRTPPSTGSRAPVMYDAAGESRNVAARPSSSGSP